MNRLSPRLYRHHWLRLHTDVEGVRDDVVALENSFLDCRLAASAIREVAAKARGTRYKANWQTPSIARARCGDKEASRLMIRSKAGD